MTDNNIDTEQLRRWRLILGHHVEEDMNKMNAGGSFSLSGDDLAMDEALAAIYEEDGTGGTSNGNGQRSAGLGSSAPRLAKWLGDVRNFFQEDVVAVIQHDAIERKGLTQLLFEPEVLSNVEPNVQLVGTLMSLRGKIPEKTKDTAREVVRKVVDKIKLLLEQKLRQAVTGALNRKQHSPIPHVASTDWQTTIRRNLANWNQEHQMLIPERFWFYSRAQRANNWTVIVALDQSGSMADSVVYGAVTGSIFASLPALDTHVVAFDTEVADLSAECGDDPVDMLFGVQLGGGTDINKAVAYCERFIQEPSKTLFILITDLFEGGNEAQLVKRMEHLSSSGVRSLCLLALSDSGVPCYDEGLARKFGKLGVPSFGCTPNLLPELVGGALRGDDIVGLVDRLKASQKSS